jgi:hypothetical protein
LVSLMLDVWGRAPAPHESKVEITTARQKSGERWETRKQE